MDVRKLQRKGCIRNMVEQDTVLIDGFWDRIDEEIHKQNKSKLQVAKKCKFDRKHYTDLKITVICASYICKIMCSITCQCRLLIIWRGKEVNAICQCQAIYG